MFGTAGVRGIFNSTQTPEEVYRLALTSAFTFGKGSYGVGWDGRKGSALLARVVTSGLSAAGSRALVFGLVPTPVTAYGTREEGCKVGFSVTASHNPPEYSGVKFFGHDGMEFSRDEELRVERAIVVDANMNSREFGEIVGAEVLGRYLRNLIGRFERSRKALKIVVDCANGPGSLVTPRALEALGHKVIPLNAQISWRFPAHPPEPTVHNLSETAAIVASLGADFGFVHDGDADRLVLVSPSGAVVPDSVVSMIALRAVVQNSGVVVLSENSSSAVEEEATKMGCRVVRSRIGKTFTKIRDEGASFATEPSKVVDPRWGMWEDGMYAAVLIADAISKEPEFLDLVKSGPRWHYRQANVPVSANMSKIADSVEAEFGRFRISEARGLDGLKLVFRDGSWIMFRPSGTEPKTRIYCESLDEARLDELLASGRKVLENAVVDGNRVR